MAVFGPTLPFKYKRREKRGTTPTAIPKKNQISQTRIRSSQTDPQPFQSNGQESSKFVYRKLPRERKHSRRRRKVAVALSGRVEEREVMTRSPMPEVGSNSSNSISEKEVLFGKYETGKLLGRGAFAKVYHARIIRTGQSVAIKCISKQKITKGGLVEHIKREISIMRRLRHRHIVKLLEVLATRSKIYFVMEYVKGGELFHKISRGRFSEDLCRKYFQQLIQAVGFCHSRGIFHRDLKPENLLLDENGNLKVSDFGLSALQDQIRNDGLFHTLCGTPAYVAPEILAKKGYDAAKVDIWSCGVILFVFNAGYLPFNDPNLMTMYRKIYRGEFRCPRWTSPDIRRMLSRLLDTNPETRITIDEIIRDPWFRKGIKEVKFQEEDFGPAFKSEPEKEEQNRHLNAFDIISFSSGFDLSPLFTDSEKSASVGELFISAESADKIIEKLLQVVESGEGVEMRKKRGWDVELHGQNGNLAVSVEIYRLTEGLVVVEVKKAGGDVRTYNGFWKKKLRPALGCLVFDPESPVASNE